MAFCGSADAVWTVIAENPAGALVCTHCNNVISMLSGYIHMGICDRTYRVYPNSPYMPVTEIYCNAYPNL